MDKAKHNELNLKKRAEWRAWLERNHDRISEVWIIYYKKNSKQSRISYEAAVEEAICFGWIDSIVKKIDEKKFCRKFTPRKKNSRWSELNKKRAEKMVRLNLITDSGLRKIEEAKRNGKWYEKQPKRVRYQMPVELEMALGNQVDARNNFNRLSKSSRNQMLGWICSAKKPETRIRRVNEVIELLKKNQKLGLK